MEEAQNRFSTLFGGFPTFPIRFPKNGESFKLADWSPLVDITEVDHEYLFKADLPEMKKDDVKVTIENGILTFPASAEPRRKKRRENSTASNASLALLSVRSPYPKMRIQPRSWLSFMTACCRFTCQNAPCRSQKQSKSKCSNALTLTASVRKVPCVRPPVWGGLVSCLLL